MPTISKGAQSSQKITKERYYELITGSITTEQKQDLKQRIDGLIYVPSNPQYLKEYCDFILSKQNGKIYSGLNRIRKILSQSTYDDTSTVEPLIQSVLDLPCLDEICQIALCSDNNLFVYEALWIIANIGMGNQNQNNEIVRRQGAQILAKAVQSSFELIVDMAAQCIGNFSANNTFRNKLVQLNIIEPLLSFAEKQKVKNLEFHKTAVWALSNIIRCPPCLKMYKKIPILFGNFIKESDDEEILTEVLWTLSKISEDKQQINLIFESGVAPKLIKLLSLQNKKFLLPSIKIIGDLLNGDDDLVDIILKLGIIKIFDSLLDRKEKGIIKETCYSLSNIAAGTADQVKQLITNNSLMIKLFNLINQQNIKYNREINYFISNVLRCGKLADIEYAIDNLGLLQSIKKLLTQSTNEEQLQIALKGIEELLKKILHADEKIRYKITSDKALNEIIEQLQYHSGLVIYTKASKILQAFQTIKKKY